MGTENKMGVEKKRRHVPSLCGTGRRGAPRSFQSGSYNDDDALELANCQSRGKGVVSLLESRARCSTPRLCVLHVEAVAVPPGRAAPPCTHRGVMVGHQKHLCGAPPRPPRPSGPPAGRVRAATAERGGVRDSHPVPPRPRSRRVVCLNNPRTLHVSVTEAMFGVLIELMSPVSDKVRV